MLLLIFKLYMGKYPIVVANYEGLPRNSLTRDCSTINLSIKHLQMEQKDTIKLRAELVTL